MRRASPGALILLVILGLAMLPLACNGEKKAGDDTTTNVASNDCSDKVINPNVDPPDNQFGLKEVTVDKFAGMNGLTITDRDELRGRIVWNLWTGDSWKMWDYLARHGFGTSDLIKTIDSRNRGQRFQRIGTINQPGFMTPAKPDQYGLWIDVPRPGDPDGQFDNGIDPKTYGRSTGVVGLRLYDNPAFDAAARAEWMKHVKNGENTDYYKNERYYTDPKLVRPYVVGMACSFCHVSFDPVRPPANVNEPKWNNLNDYVGAQYLKVYEVFMPRLKDQPEDHYRESFVWQLLHTNPPGTLDTSFIATDYINNPGTMNGVFSLGARIEAASLWPKEKMTGGALNLRGLTNCENVPRVLKQGDDSVGLQAALSRVYVNIGESWDEWSKHFRPLVGGPRPGALHGQTPVEVAVLQKTSDSWNWSEQRAQYLAKYLIKYAQPLLLKDAPGGAAHLTTDQNVLNRGKQVFAEHCAQCHSSKQPPKNIDPASPAGKQWFLNAINDPNFWNNNFYGNEQRYSVAEIGTNAARAAATNAMRGHIWDNFSSETYKTLPKIQPITVKHPFDNTDVTFQIQGGGPGWYRPPSLISLWSSAPFLHNNTVGPREPARYGVDVDARMRAFNESIEKLLLIQPRDNVVWKTSATSYILIPQTYAPALLQKLIVDPRLKDGLGNYKIGPIPEKMPVNLLSNVNLGGNDRDLLRLGVSITAALIEIRLRNLKGEAATARLRETVPHLMKVNSVPDFVMDRGHLFGTQLPESDKRALIELLKTF